jgi:hypothetical protein
MYKILASDGNEYDSISAEKIRQWIRENRVEPKTPVMPEGAADWMFLSDLPEFAQYFTGQQKRRARNDPHGRSRWLKLSFGLLLVLLAAALIALAILKKNKHP